MTNGNTFSETEIDTTINVLDIVREEAIKDRRYGFDEDWIPFMKKMRLLTPQSSGARFQNRIFESLGWEPVDQKLGKGDVKNSMNQHFEVKATVITTSNSSANIVQIRPWQEISGHYIFVIDSFNDYKVDTFFLSKSDMNKEVELCANHSHGTKIINKENNHIEWSIRIPWNKEDKVYKRWQKYKDNDIDVASLNSK